MKLCAGVESSRDLTAGGAYDTLDFLEQRLAERAK